MEIRVREKNEEGEQYEVFPLMEVAFQSDGCCIRIGKGEGTSGLNR
jgi:hypothetical protein